MLRTWAFFTIGGLFTASYSNAVRKLPLLRSPALYFWCVGTGCLIGFLAHAYEENTEARYRRILERNPDAPEKLKLTLKAALKEKD
uniref:Uncharacterized protein n=1 Tax=Amphimedon queenslandica TaxID=400682 RepID=A0A1X7ULB7_AMPQE